MKCENEQCNYFLKNGHRTDLETEKREWNGSSFDQTDIPPYCHYCGWTPRTETQPVYVCNACGGALILRVGPIDDDRNPEIERVCIEPGCGKIHPLDKMDDRGKGMHG